MERPQAEGDRLSHGGRLFESRPCDFFYKADCHRDKIFTNQADMPAIAVLEISKE
jgi:hypothetical protein